MTSSAIAIIDAGRLRPKGFGCLEVDAHHIPVRLFYGDFAGGAAPFRILSTKRAL